MSTTTTAPPLDRVLTLDERLTWGECPTCAAPHGTYCRPGVVLQPRFGTRYGEGAHICRLRRAPTRVRKEVAACAACWGSGRVTRGRSEHYGMATEECPSCSGTGRGKEGT